MNIDPPLVDSATIWYGMFDGKHWVQLRRIARVSHAKLEAALTSDLVVQGTTLSFAFGYDASGATGLGSPAADQGVILLQRRGNAWHLDTLQTWAGPNYVRLVAGPKPRSLLVGIMQPYFAEGRPHASSMFLAMHDTGWHVPVRVAGNGKRPLFAPELTVAGTRGTLSWMSGSIAGDERPLLESKSFTVGAATLAIDDSSKTVTVGSASEDYDVAAIDSTHFLWLVRDGTAAHAYIRIANEVTDAGLVHLPMASPRARLIRVSPSTFDVVSSSFGTAGSGPAATTFITRLSLRCSGGR